MLCFAVLKCEFNEHTGNSTNEVNRLSWFRCAFYLFDRWTSGSRRLSRTRCGAIFVRFFLCSAHFVVFIQPATEINGSAPLRAERIVRVLAPVSGHPGITNRTLHFDHWLPPARHLGLPTQLDIAYFFFLPGLAGGSGGGGGGGGGGLVPSAGFASGGLAASASFLAAAW